MRDICKWERVVLENTIMHHTTPSRLPHSALHSPSRFITYSQPLKENSWLQDVNPQVLGLLDCL